MVHQRELERKLYIGKDALEFIKKELAAENAPAMRISTSGGCCSRFEIMPVKKPLAGDVVYSHGGISIYVERELDENSSAIEIKLDERKGLIIELANRETLNKNNSQYCE